MRTHTQIHTLAFYWKTLSNQPCQSDGQTDIIETDFMHMILEINLAENSYLGIGIANRFWNIKNIGTHTKYEHESFGT